MAEHVMPAYDLVVDGVSINPRVNPRLKSFRLTEKDGTDPDDLQLVLDDSDGALAIPPAGAIITLKLGWLDLRQGAAPRLIDKGRFEVQDRQHDGTPDQLTITARSDKARPSFRSRRTQTWTATTLGAVLEEVAARNGLQPRIWPEKAALQISTLTQRNESDSAFLTRLGRLHDAIATVKNESLLFGPIGADQSAGGEPIPRLLITRASGDRHNWKASERDKAGGFKAEWQDRSTGQRKTVTVGSGTNARKLGRVFSSEEAARQAAEAALSKADRKGATFSLNLAMGRPEAYPAQKATLQGWKPEIDASDWLIKECQHSFDGSGLRTTIQCELGKSASSTSNTNQ